MRGVQRSAAARKDFYDIFVHVGEDSVDAARRLIRLLDEKVRLLSQFPGMGQHRDELGAGLRSFPVDNYLIIYRDAHPGIQLVRVVHGARDLRSLFPSSEP